MERQCTCCTDYFETTDGGAVCATCDKAICASCCTELQVELSACQEHELERFNSHVRRGMESLTRAHAAERRTLELMRDEYRREAKALLVRITQLEQASSQVAA